MTMLLKHRCPVCRGVGWLAGNGPDPEMCWGEGAFEHPGEVMEPEGDPITLDEWIERAKDGAA